MSKKIAERLPRELGEGVLPNHASVQSPWGKLVSYQDAVHYASRYGCVVAAALMQALRILVPDYEERATKMCQTAYDSNIANRGPLGGHYRDILNMHPFCVGDFTGALVGDIYDEALLMCGRVNDFGTHRVEKELDVCDWDIIGSELCRATVVGLQAIAESVAKYVKSGPKLEYCMVEAKGCGDRHCRVVAENREKYPMPSHKIWESFGPVATADQIKFTNEEDTISESHMFREECGFAFSNGTCTERDSSHAYYSVYNCGASYILNALDAYLKEGKFTHEQANHTIKCVCEAAGKAFFGAFYAREGLRQWMGVPNSISNDDARVMGGQIEMLLKCMRYHYDIEAFNEQEAIYILNRNELKCYTSKLDIAYLSFWHGATKTLLNAQWALWEEPKEDTPADKIRIKIAKKIDKFA